MVTASLSLRLGEPSSVATTSNVYAPGPCASAGVHENAPLVALMTAPAGAPTSEYAMVSGGESFGSVADAVNVMAVPSSPEVSATGASAGGSFTSPPSP